MMEDTKLKLELDALRKLYVLLKYSWVHSKNAVSDYYLDDNTLCFLKSLLDAAANRVFEDHLKSKTEERPVLVPSLSFNNNHLKMSAKAKASEIISMKAEEEDKQKSHKIVSDGSLQFQTTGKKRHCRICQKTNDPGMTVSKLDLQQFSKSIHLNQIKGHGEGIEFNTTNCRDTNEQKDIHKSTAKQFEEIFSDDHPPSSTIPSEIDDVIKKIEWHISVLHSAVGRQIDPLEENSPSNFVEEDSTKDEVLQNEHNMVSSGRSSFYKRPTHRMSLIKKSRRNLDWQQSQDWSESRPNESIETKSSTEYSSCSRPSTTSDDGSEEYLYQNVETSSSDSKQYSDSSNNSEGSTSSSSRRSVSSTKNYKKQKQKGRLRRLKDKLAIIFHHHNHRHHHHHHSDVVTNNGKAAEVHAERIVHAGDDKKKYGKNVALLKAPDKNRKGHFHFHALAEGLLKRHVRNLKRSKKKQPKTDIKPRGMKCGDGMMAKKLHWWQILSRQRKGLRVKFPNKPRVKLVGQERKKRRSKAL